MLAILDPGLRHSTPNRRQSAMLIGTLALIAVVVGAAAPAPRASIVVASSVPAVEPTALVGGKTQKPTDRTEARSTRSEKRNEKLEVRDYQKERVRETVESPKPEAVADAEADARAAVEVSTGAARVLEAYGEKLERVGAARADERPALLANILRTDKDASLRRIAAWGLSEHAGTSVAAEALAHALRRDSDVSVREMAGWALSDARPNSVAVSALSEAVRSDASEKVRAIAAWSLGNIGDDDAVAPLTAALADASKGVRARAAWAIGSIEPRKAPPALVAMLRDPQPVIRQLTAWALFRIEDPSTAGALQAALQTETNAELKMHYIQAIAALGEQSVDAVKSLLLSPDPKIKSMAVRALAGGQASGPWPWPWPEPRPYP